MKKASDVFKSIRFAKGEPRDKPHSSTDEEGHYTVGEREYNQQLQHVKKMAMQEEVKDKYDEGEYDREGDMAKSDLRSIINNAKRLHDMIDDADNLPEWCQSKITLAEDYISTVTNYMTAEINEEVEYLEEKNAPTNPELWSRAKALAKSKFDVYPSAYANGWAAKWYKSKGGGWKTVSEEVEQLDEIENTTRKSYLEKANAAVKELKPHAKGEYGDIAKNIIARRKRGIELAKRTMKKEDVEQLVEMPGANMDTRAVHSHLKKKGWKLTRTAGSHDVFTHPDAEHHISVPRHKQLKAPLVKGILRQSSVNEDILIDDEIIDSIIQTLDEGSTGWHPSSTEKNPNFNDELSNRRVSPPGRRLKSGKLSDAERRSQERLKALIRYGGLTGPKGHLPEEQSVAEETIEEGEGIVTRRKNIKATPAPGTYAARLAAGEYEKYGYTRSGRRTAAAKRRDKEESKPFPIKEAETPPFEGGQKKKEDAVDKSGARHTAMSRAKHLARQAMKNQTKNMKKPRLEEEKENQLDKKAKIVRNALKDGKKKQNTDMTSGGKDKFEANPELTSQIVKT